MFNLPDGCIWVSDQDYYDAMRGPFDREEADDDPTPEDERDEEVRA